MNNKNKNLRMLELKNLTQFKNRKPYLPSRKPDFRITMKKRLGSNNWGQGFTDVWLLEQILRTTLSVNSKGFISSRTSKNKHVVLYPFRLDLKHSFVITICRNLVLKKSVVCGDGGSLFPYIKQFVENLKHTRER